MPLNRWSLITGDGCVQQELRTLLRQAGRLDALEEFLAEQDVESQFRRPQIPHVREVLMRAVGRWLGQKFSPRL